VAKAADAEELFAMVVFIQADIRKLIANNEQ
jgi:hypothetical protein